MVVEQYLGLTLKKLSFLIIKPNGDDFLIETIGFAAGVLGIVAWIPQVKTVWIDKRHDGVSLPTFAVVAIALTLWMIYGILLPSPSIIFSNAAALMMILSVIIGVVRIRRAET
tara:strand:- start:1350 stop:1688 length:339 start_codon:yes stop_codon:yes gene_type:complete